MYPDPNRPVSTHLLSSTRPRSYAIPLAHHVSHSNISPLRPREPRGRGAVKGPDQTPTMRHFRVDAVATVDAW